MTTKENIISILQTHKSEFSKYGVSDIGLFGSYLRNEQSNQSDIDFLIDFCNRSQSSTWYSLKEEKATS